MRITVDIEQAQPTEAERIAAFAASMGRPLTAWQVRYLEQLAAQREQ